MIDMIQSPSNEEAMDYFNRKGFHPVVSYTMSQVEVWVRKTNKASTKLRRFLERDKRFNPKDLSFVLQEINVIVKELGGSTTMSTSGTVSAVPSPQRAQVAQVKEEEWKRGGVTTLRIVETNASGKVKSPTIDTRMEWAEKTYKELRNRGTPRLKEFIKSTLDVVQILGLEVGTSNPMNIYEVNASGFMGPFQVGHAAWKDGPAQFSQFGTSTHDKLKAATKAGLVGGPADVNVMAPGIIIFWNRSVDAFYNEARRQGIVAQVAALPKNFETLYLIHNQGGAGALRIVMGGSTVGNQSSKADSIINRIRGRKGGRMD